MTQPAPPLIIGLICIIAFLFLFVTGIKFKSLNRIMFSIGFLLLSIFCSLWFSFIAIGKAYNKVKEYIPDTSKIFQQRQPYEAYAALFGAPIDSCLKPLRLMDQVVPRLDCCIWLEFKACPTEINRIISLNIYKVSEHSSSDTLSYLPGYSPRPDWWTPHTLGDKIIVFRDDSKIPNHEKILIISSDSSHAFYCDMTD